LNNNLDQIAQVREWANKMGYGSAKKFSRRFQRHFSVRPCKILIEMRLRSIYKHLQHDSYSNFYIARRHGLPDEIGLNKFVNYHLNYSPSELKKISPEEFNKKIEKFGSKVR
jgi:transcriptional regulator GlxA family with amidase domain